MQAKSSFVGSSRNQQILIRALGLSSCDSRSACINGRPWNLVARDGSVDIDTDAGIGRRVGTRELDGCWRSIAPAADGELVSKQIDMSAQYSLDSSFVGWGNISLFGS